MQCQQLAQNYRTSEHQSHNSNSASLTLVLTPAAMRTQCLSGGKKRWDGKRNLGQDNSWGGDWQASSARAELLWEPGAGSQGRM